MTRLNQRRIRLQEHERIFRSLERLQRFVKMLTRGIPAYSAFLLGVFVNAISDAKTASISDILNRTYDVSSRSIAWINVTATALLATPFIRAGLSTLVGTSTQATRLSQHLQNRVAPSLRQFSRGRIAWGEEIVLQSCPKINEGWRTEDVRIIHDHTNFRFELPDHKEAFERWSRSTREDVTQRGPKYRLKDNPASFSDDPRLILRVQEATYAQALFVNRNLSLIGTQRTRLIRETLEGKLSYPHIFCLHLTVATSDDYVLLTHRSHKVAYDPGTWSCSLEEQLSEHDFKGADSEVMSLWLRRALVEELGLSTSEASRSDARILAVFLEADRLNTGLAALVSLDLTRDELDAIIDRRPREDYEFQDWAFLKWSELASELSQPTRPYHPSSGLRMLLAGIVHYGVFGFSEKLDRVLGR